CGSFRSELTTSSWDSGDSDILIPSEIDIFFQSSLPITSADSRSEHSRHRVDGSFIMSAFSNASIPSDFRPTFRLFAASSSAQVDVHMVYYYDLHYV
ncbi:8345_t:CDS:2, partial [Acaulospora morrowiae]